MKAVMSLRPGAELAQTMALLRRHGAQARALHPGTTDAGLAAWFEVSGPDPSELAAVIEALQHHPAVDSALLKPDDEAPR